MPPARPPRSSSPIRSRPSRPPATLLPAGGSFRQIEFVGILKGAEEPDLARQWVDFMLGETFQADIPLQMWVYPARTGTPLPEVFAQFAQMPAQPVRITPAQIEAGREGWLKAWTERCCADA